MSVLDRYKIQEKKIQVFQSVPKPISKAWKLEKVLKEALLGKEYMSDNEKAGEVEYVRYSLGKKASKDDISDFNTELIPTVSRFATKFYHDKNKGSLFIRASERQMIGNKIRLNKKFDLVNKPVK